MGNEHIEVDSREYVNQRLQKIRESDTYAECIFALQYNTNEPLSYFNARNCDTATIAKVYLGLKAMTKQLEDNYPEIKFIASLYGITVTCLKKEDEKTEATEFKYNLDGKEQIKNIADGLEALYNSFKNKIEIKRRSKFWKKQKKQKR